MKKNRSSLRLKLIVVSFSFFLFIFGIFCISNYAIFTISSNKTQYNQLDNLINEHQLVDNYNKEQVTLVNLLFIEGDIENKTIIITDLSDELKESNLNKKIQQIYGAGKSFFHFSYNDHDYFAKLITTDDSFFIIINQGESFNPFTFYEFYLLSSLFFLVLASSGLFYFFWSKRLITNIKILQNNINLLKESNYETEFTIPNTKDELYDLALSIREMKEIIYKEHLHREELLQNISHDLKTPISVIKSYAEAGLDQVINNLESFNTILDQTQRLEEKVSSLLLFSKLKYLKDSNNVLTKVNIKDIIDKVIKNYRFKKEVEIKVSVIKNTDFVGVPAEWQIVIENILDNAIRYAISEVIITIDLNYISIFNNGKPIQEVLLNTIFEPFEKSSDGNFGLGLAIAKKTCDLFGYRIKASNTSNGVIFEINKADLI